MLDAARRHLRETIAADDAPQDLDARVAEATSAHGHSDEQRAALWLFAWHCTDGDGARSPATVARGPRGRA